MTNSFLKTAKVDGSVLNSIIYLQSLYVNNYHLKLQTMSSLTVEHSFINRDKNIQIGILQPKIKTSFLSRINFRI